MKQLISIILLIVSICASIATLIILLSGCTNVPPDLGTTSQSVVLPATCSYTPHLGETPAPGGFCGYGLTPITWRGLTFCSSGDCSGIGDPCYHDEGRCVQVNLQPFTWTTWCLPFADHGDLYGCPAGFEIDGPTDICIPPEA